MDIREVPAIETLALRQRVLRPHQTLDELAREDDTHDAVHFAAIDAGTVIGSASVHREPPPWAAGEPRAWQLRGMATDDARRRQGVGRAVLDAIIEYVHARGGGVVWCNARTPAVAFYADAGFTTEGETWEIPHIGPHIAMHREVEPGV